MLGHNIGGGYKGVTLDSLQPPESTRVGEPRCHYFLGLCMEQASMSAAKECQKHTWVTKGDKALLTGNFTPLLSYRFGRSGLDHEKEVKR